MQATLKNKLLMLMLLTAALQWMPPVITPGHCQLAVIQIDYSDPDDLLGAVSTVLSPTGRISFDRRTHSLIVNDTPQAVDQVRALVRQLDRPAVRLSIRVRMGSDGRKARQALAAEGRISGPGWSVGTHGRAPAGLGVTYQQEKTAGRRQTEYVVKGQSGRPAYIITGKDVPFTSRWTSICNRYGGCRRQVDYKRVETGFEVLPLVRGRWVRVDITPRFSSHEGGVIRFSGAATRLRVPLGRWVDIGGVTGSSNEAVTAVMDRGSREGAQTTSFWMRIEKEAP